MGILGNWGTRTRGQRASGARLKLYPVATAPAVEPVDDEEDSLIVASSDEDIDQASEALLAPVGVQVEEPRVEPGEVLLAPIEPEMDLLEVAISGEKRARVLGVPDGWSEVDESSWSLELLQVMDWKLFEFPCANAKYL